MISWLFFPLIGTSGLVKLSCLIQQLSFHILLSFWLRVLPAFYILPRSKSHFRVSPAKKITKQWQLEKNRKKSRNKAIYSINIPISTKICVISGNWSKKSWTKKTKLISFASKVNQSTHVSMYNLCRPSNFFFCKKFFNSRDWL